MTDKEHIASLLLTVARLEAANAELVKRLTELLKAYKLM